jgi:pre-mRNA-splicing factor SYF2
MASSSSAASGKSRPDCVNSSNPYHECSDYCLRQIVKSREDNHRWSRVHPDCINASNPYHVCSEYCFKRIADAKSGASPASSSRFCTYFLI